MQGIKKDFAFTADTMEEVHIGWYRYYKGGDYEVLDVTRHSETKEEMVIYRALVDGTLWVRPKKMFLEKVRNERMNLPRFSLVR